MAALEPVTRSLTGGRLGDVMFFRACALCLCSFVALVPLAAQSNPDPVPSFSFPNLSGTDSLADRRRAMVDHLAATFDLSQRLGDALLSVPRERFLPDYLRNLAYEDSSLPLGSGQALPSPSDIVRVAQALALDPTDSLLIYGADTGYAAAVYSRLVARVYVVEIEAGARASEERIFASLGITNITVAPDGSPTSFLNIAPFDKLLVHGAVEEIPPALLSQLRTNGRLVAPLADTSGFQMLVLVQNAPRTPEIRSVGKCFFPQIQTAGK